MQCSASVLFIDTVDLTAESNGGGSAFAKQMLRLYRGSVAFVGFTADSKAIGRWSKQGPVGAQYEFYGLGRRVTNSARPIIPERIRTVALLALHRRRILQHPARNVFIQSPEVLICARWWGWQSICYIFHGAENPLSKARYAIGRLLASIFEKCLFKALDNVETVLVAADLEACERLSARSNGALPLKRLLLFPTCYDEAIFYPQSRLEARKQLAFGDREIVVVQCGRLNRVKGWDLTIEAFARLCSVKGGAQLVFVGDGEDRAQLLSLARLYGVGDCVRLTGFVSSEVVATYYAAADVAVFASHYEGWSLAMVEAVACGVPIVSTLVSGASSMVIDGHNGYIVRSRQSSEFAEAMANAIALRDARRSSDQISRKHRLSAMARRLNEAWPALKESAAREVIGSDAG